MLIVGLISTREEQYEIKYIANMCVVGERIRYLAREQRMENKSNTSTKKSNKK